MDLIKIKDIQPRTILDIGAHFGWFHTLAKGVWPEAHIYMIDANENVLDMLKAIENGKYTIQLLGDEEKEVDFYTTKEDKYCSGHSIYRENTEHYSDDNLIVEKKQMSTLAKILEPYAVFDLMKIDTKGSEVDIMIGGKELCQRAKYIILEVSLEEYNTGAPLKDDVLSFMDELGFSQLEVLGKPHPVQEDIIFINKKLVGGFPW